VVEVAALDRLIYGAGHMTEDYWLAVFALVLGLVGFWIVAH
jgi:hypothetical protein